MVFHLSLIFPSRNDPLHSRWNVLYMNKYVIYINELKQISKGCDCDPFSGPIICPDIGYLISDDPVAIDKASLDLINHVKPNLFEKENKINPFKQIMFGEEIGLGSTSYQLIEL